MDGTPVTWESRKRKAPMFAASAPKRPRTTAAKKAKKRTYTKKVAVKPKKAVKINKSRIDKLEEKINGHVQRGYQMLYLNPNPPEWIWRPSQPILLPLNDFYSQQTASAGGTGSAYFPVYSGDPALGTMITKAKALDRWFDFTPGATLGLADQFRQWSNVKNSQPSRVGYQPIYTDVRFVLNRSRCTPDGGDLWVRLDVFKAKKTFLPTAGGVDPKQYNMPGALGSLSQMAVGPNVRQNSFNPALWSVKTRWIKLPAVDVPSRDINTVFHVKMAFPKKFLVTNVDVDATGIGEQFYNCVDPKQIHWLMLSISRESPNQTTDPTPTLTCTRKIVYRDSRGAQM